jgi:3-oxoacyl-[acyl-carrier-protein] synthase-3
LNVTGGAIDMTDMPTGVLGIGAYVPERVMTNDEWADHVDTSDEWITARTGIKTRRIAADDQTTVDLAAAAAERALADADVEIEDVDEIIVATDTPEVFIPDTASYLQNRLGAREVPAFDLAGSSTSPARELRPATGRFSWSESSF